MTPNTDAPDADAPVLLTMMLIILTPHAIKKKENHMTPNTDDPIDDDPDAAGDDADSPDSLIIDSSIKRKIDPKSMPKLKKLQWQ